MLVMTRLIHDSKVLRGQSPYHEKWCKVVERANLSLGILRKSQFKSPLTTCELLILKALYIYIYRCKSVSQAASHSPCIYIFCEEFGGQNLKKGLPWDDGATHGLSSQVEVGGWAPESPYVMVENFCRLVAFR